MKKSSLFACLLALFFSWVISAPTPAMASVECVGTLRGTISGDVVVPHVRECGINATVNGDIHVLDSGWLLVDGGHINGSVISTGANRVEVRDARVTGDISGTGIRRFFSVHGATVDGSVLIRESKGTIVVGSSLVSSSVTVSANSGETIVSGNTVGRYLVCEHNAPAPVATEDNVVSQRATGQCTSLSVRPTAADEVDVYVTPGLHTVNSRNWRTVCQPYSLTERCRTEIMAATVHYSGGQYKVVNDWTFNNLTYKASPRSLWANNPLAAQGEYGGTATWYSSDGRQWRTECDSSLTGRGGCRTWVTAQVIQYRNGAYEWVTKEILNNMVRFND